MEKDQRDLLREFNAHNVRYLVVGGYAYSHHTEPRATKDLDVFIECSPENAGAVFSALANFGAPLTDISANDFQDGKSFFQLGVPPSRIDIIQMLDSVDFESAWRRSEAGMIGDDIPVRYISIDDLIENKLAVGRPRDLADVDDLRKAKLTHSTANE